MSTVQPCLETKEMAAPNAEFLDSFRTIDEDKDSDEESFHLFSDDDDEMNKSEDKTQLEEKDEDANKNKDEEKEKVNEPNAVEGRNTDHSENINSRTENIKKTESILDEKSTDKYDIQENTSKTVENCKKPTENKDTIQNTTADNGETIEMDTEENVPTENKQISSTEVDNSASTSQECEEMECEDEETKKIKVVNESNVEEKQTKLNSNDKATSLLESEDDILNKHATEVADTLEEDLDPNLEESLLDENDEVSGKNIPKETPVSSNSKSSVTEESISNKHNELDSSELITQSDELKVKQTEIPQAKETSENIKVSSNTEACVTEEAVDVSTEVESKTAEIAENNMKEAELQNEKLGANSEEKNVINEKMGNTESESVIPQKCDDNSSGNSPNQSVIPQKCDGNSIDQSKCNDNSNGNTINSQKCDDISNGNSDTEDLLDISMIKDSAQDDADIAEDALQLEQENDDSNYNAASNASKVVERSESVDDSSNLENSDEDGKGGYGSESQEALDHLQVDSDFEKEKDLLEKDLPENGDDKEGNIEKEVEVMECEKDDDSSHRDNDSTIIPPKEIVTSNTDKAPLKRGISDEILESNPKKIKLVEEVEIIENDKDGWDITELESLMSFSKFMTKSQLKKLTRADLEEFCVQKLCEAILHKSELGETNHQLKIQEQTIEALRKEQSVLTKQIKDLEIVNKKLLCEVKNHLGNKPIVPVKITRSVGLQVRMAPTNDAANAKRRSINTTPQKTPTPTPPRVVNQNNQNNRSPGMTPPTAPTTVNRTVFKKSPLKTGVPILTQVLQNRNRAVVKNVPAQTNTSPRGNPTTAVKQKPTPEKRSRPTGSFIDLTDEDDKRTTIQKQNTPVQKQTTPVQKQNALKTVVPQGLRINSVPKTTMSSVLPSVVTSAPQVMYVVQSNSQIKQGLLTTPAGQQKAVLVNFQPTNGVISSLNTSSVSVIPKAASNVQMKTTSSLVKLNNKHPAPLPNPPIVQGLNDKSLKGIPPKPVLSIRKTNNGIILQWRMPYDLGLFEVIASYQLYAYQETSALPSTDMWRKVGDVKAMALPMACTLTQFAEKNKYYFAVRPVDIHNRTGRFSNPEEISL